LQETNLEDGRRMQKMEQYTDEIVKKQAKVTGEQMGVTNLVYKNWSVFYSRK
jgi:hypothetical protein